MKSIFLTLVTMVFFYFNANVSAQQLFEDSSQRLGNSCSWDVKLGDLDGDGDLDAVIANYDWVKKWDEGPTQKNEIWLNNGNGTFVKSAQVLGSSQKVSLYDVDNNGKLDIIEYNNQTQTISTWINRGNATFSLSGKYPFKGFRVLFDNKINGDFQNEVITLGYGEDKNKTMIVWFYSLRNGSMMLKDSIIIDKTSGNRINVSGQKAPDFILLNKKGEYNISDQNLRDFLIANHSLGDVNGDGFLDILQCNYHLFATTHLYVSYGAENLKEVSIPFKTFFSKQIDSCFINQNGELVDLDNDGDVDIYLNRGHQEICCSKKSEILFNDGHGNFTPCAIDLDMVQSISAAFGDLDNDGDPDAFLACGIQTSARSMIGEPNRVWVNTTVENKINLK